MAAVYETIAHAPEASVGLLEDRIHTITSRQARLQAVADAYLDGGPARVDTLGLTPSNEDRVELNARIRQGLRSEGVLQGPDHRVEVLVGRGLTKAQATESAYYAVGDQVRFGRSYKSLGVQGGETWRVAAIDVGANRVTLEGEGANRSSGSPTVTIRWRCTGPRSATSPPATGSGGPAMSRRSTAGTASAPRWWPWPKTGGPHRSG